jgi:hypothetical protein
MTMAKRVLLVAIVLLITAVYPIGALPGSESDTTYYDLDMNLIGEHVITCSGAHYVWGSQTGVYRSAEVDSCNTDNYSRTCSYSSSCCGWLDYSCDDPPPCGNGANCG